MRLADEPAVLFELRLAGAADADAAAVIPRQVGPHLLQPRQRVFQLGQLDLQPGLRRAGPGGEDVEDQLAAVEDLDAGRLFQVADLGRGEVVVEDDDVGVGGLDAALATPRPCPCRCRWPGLMSCRFWVSSPTTVGAGGVGQAAQLVQRVAGPRADPAGPR